MHYQEHSINQMLLGYGTLLEFAYNRKANVITRGMSGYTTRDGLSVLPGMINEFQSHPPALITIAFGTNDALRRPLPRARRHPDGRVLAHRCAPHGAVRLRGCDRHRPGIRPRAGPPPPRPPPTRPRPDSQRSRRSAA